MEICEICGCEAPALCTVSVFIPGEDENGIHNMQQIGRLCDVCIEKLFDRELIIQKPHNFIHMFGGG